MKVQIMHHIQQLHVLHKSFVQNAEKVMDFQMIRPNAWLALHLVVQVIATLQDKIVVTIKQFNAHIWMKMEIACKVVLKADTLK